MLNRGQHLPRDPDILVGMVLERDAEIERLKGLLMYSFTLIVLAAIGLPTLLSEVIFNYYTLSVLVVR